VGSVALFCDELVLDWFALLLFALLLLVRASDLENKRSIEKQAKSKIVSAFGRSHHDESMVERGTHFFAAAALVVGAAVDLPFAPAALGAAGGAAATLE